MSMQSLPSELADFSDRRRRAHVIAGSVILAIAYAAMMLFVRIVLL